MKIHFTFTYEIDESEINIPESILNDPNIDNFQYKLERALEAAYWDLDYKLEHNELRDNLSESISFGD